MADDGEVRINTKVDTSGLDKGLNDINKKVDKTNKTLNKGTTTTQKLNSVLTEASGKAGGFANKLSGIATSGGVAVAAITAGIVAAKKYIQAIRDTSEVYKVQQKAEVGLETAAMNNPYINGEGIENLKKFAAQLQQNSDIGDETILKYTSQLVAAGRTQEEITSILQASADISASGAMTFEGAIRNLNKTFSGLSGELGESVPQIKDLTTEQLKNGEAVGVIAKQYSGFAKNLADARIQAQNAKGDFMESIGKIANPAFEKLEQNATKFWNTLTEKAQEFDAWLDYQGAKFHLNENVEKAITTYTNKNTGEVVQGVKLLTDELLKNTITILENKEAHKLLSDEEADALIRLKDEAGYRERLAKYEAEEAEKAEKLKKQKEAEAAAEAKNTQAKKTADEYARESNQRLEDNLKALEVEAKAKGQAVSAQDKYNVYLQSYIDLLTKTEGKIKEGYPVEKKRLEQLHEAKAAVDAATSAEEKLAASIEYTQAATEAINSIKRQLTPAEELQKEIDSINTLKAQIESLSETEVNEAQKDTENKLTKQQLLDGLNEAEKETTRNKVEEIASIEQGAWDEQAAKQKELLELKQSINDSEVLSEEEKVEALKQIDNAYAQSRAQQFSDIATQVKGYVDQTVEVAKNAAQLMSDTVQNQCDAELASLEMKYQKGEISEEEYNEKVTETKKKAAKEQYKIEMFQWSASILQATANIAQGVSQAIAQGGVAGLITGALVSAAGAVQIASIIASKPTPPSFSTGGIVSGSSYNGDNIASNLNSREMVMNMNQQKGLWDFINGGSGSGGGANIVINNSASNIATAQPKLSRDKIEIMIDARVNDSLKNGRYDKSLGAANQGLNGDYYGI